MMTEHLFVGGPRGDIRKRLAKRCAARIVIPIIWTEGWFGGIYNMLYRKDGDAYRYVHTTCGCGCDEVVSDETVRAATVKSMVMA